MVLTTCRKRPELKIYKLELSDEVVAVTPYGATIIANYTYPGEIPQIKVCVSTNSEVTNATETDAVLDKTTMTATIEGLSSDTKYYYRFKYSNGISLIYTDTKDFTTEHAVVVPSVVTIPITTITANSAVSGGAISDNGGDEIIEKGICWSTTEQPTIDDAHTSDGSGNGAFVSNMTELSPNTVYYVRAYATNSDGVGYGNELSFTTTASLASLTTKTVTNITPTSASCGGNITNSGGMDITARGVCWSTSHNPSLDDQHSEDGTGIGDFNSNLTGLIANVKYYVRAYATSSYGTSYGNEVEFTTQMGAPTVTTKSVTGITGSSASCGGNVTNSGGGTITARGVCWSTSQNPTIADNHTTDGTGTGEFTSSITGLDNNVTYYVRAYAANSNGTSYGEERDFTTQEGLAIVTTNNVTSITATSAICGGEVTKDVRGLNRLHQFDKVEIVQLALPEKSYEALDGMVAHVEQLVRSLGLPYRILRLCGGDMSFTSALTYDFEVYSEAQKRWLEVSSVSNFESFQANRLKLRYRSADKKTQLAHTLNGSSLALPRIVAALLENNQTENGIRIPEVLVPYTGFDMID